MGTTHLCLLARTKMFVFAELSSASRSRGGSEEVYPLRTFTIHRIAVGHLSHTVFAQRGSVSMQLLILRIAADWRNVNQHLPSLRTLRTIGKCKFEKPARVEHLAILYVLYSRRYYR